MTNNDKHNWLTSKNIFIGLLAMSILYFGVNSLVDNRFTVITENTRNEVNNQQLLLTAIAETISRNGADDVVESIVIDCSQAERTEFDRLLSRLDLGLNRTELVEVERLFGRCGAFFADRKAVMTARLTREISVYESFVNQLSVVTDSDLAEQYRLEEWKALSEQERKQSELFSQMVVLQDRIITTLLEGKSANSEEILSILDEVKEVQENLLLATTKATEIRNRLIAI
jgi:hypothetical protein